MSNSATYSGDAGSGGFPAGLAVARINLDMVRRNWRHLASLSKNTPPMAVVKADAYGHGLKETAATLLDAGCRSFAVGSMSEGVLLRGMLEGGEREVTVLPLLGVMTPGDAASAVAHNLLPLVCSAEQAAMVSAASTGSAPLPVAVKIDTGMARLGFRASRTRDCIAALRSFANLRPVLLLSHFAAADDPAQDASVASQVKNFLQSYSAMRDFWPDMDISLANSAAFLAQDILLAALPPHISRPGYALYGGNPFAGTDREFLGAPLSPAMDVTAPVMGVYDLAPGQTVSYGCTFTAEKNMRIAIVGAGYANGFSRGLSGRGSVCIRGERCPVLGRVCMQMHIVDVSHVPGAVFGDTAHILGGEGPGAVTAEDISRDWGTIPYEVFCLLGRNPRVYS